MVYTHEEINETLLAAADAQGEPLTKAAYRAYRNVQNSTTGLPSAKPIVKGAAGYGSWRAACEANDIALTAPGPDRSVSIADRIRALREAAAELGEPLTATAYRDWRRNREDAPTIENRLHDAPQGIEGWADWCALAGVTTAKRDTWTPLECLYALRLPYRDNGVRFSEPTYREWRAAQDELYPGATAITHHWPSFTAARAIALGDPDKVPPKAWDG